MVEQVSVEAFVKPALGIEEPGVPLELFAALEGGNELLDHAFLFLGQRIRILGVDGGELEVLKRIRLFPDGHRAVLVIHLVEQKPLLHLKFRMPLDDLPFQLELDDQNCLVHFAYQPQILGPVFLLVLGVLGCKAGGIMIGLLGEHRQRPQVDAVSVLDHI